MKIHTFTSTLGIPWVVKLVPAGRLYGFLNGTGGPCLKADKDTIEFYDARSDFTLLGQFVSRYYTETLVNRSYKTAQGLNLHGGEPDWQISGLELFCALTGLGLVGKGD